MAQKEKLLLADMNVSKGKKIALWSLGVGLVSLVGYGIYKAISDSDNPKSKEKKKKVPADWPITDSAIENLAPTVGKWLLKQLKD